MNSVRVEPAHKHVFTTLDALRGIAALSVVLYHTNSLSAHLFRHGYLAVDFFFVLSGFVLSYAYGKRLGAGWPARDFFRVRAIRLFPLSTLGLILGVAVALAGISNPPVLVPPSRMPWAVALNLFFLPAPPFSHPPVLFPYNMVAWSLFFELVSNAVHVLFLRRAKTATLVALAAVTGSVLCVEVLQAGTANIGYDSITRITGFVRVLFSYVVGMLLFRLWQHRPTRLSVSPALMCLLLIAVLAVTVPSRLSAAYDIASIAVFMPAIVLLSSYGRSRTPYALALQALGTASYAIYVLQSPVLSLLNWLCLGFAHGTLADERPWSGLIVLFVIFVVAFAADRYFDIPARRRMQLFLQ